MTTVKHEMLRIRLEEEGILNIPEGGFLFHPKKDFEHKFKRKTLFENESLNPKMNETIKSSNEDFRTALNHTKHKLAIRARIALNYRSIQDISTHATVIFPKIDIAKHLLLNDENSLKSQKINEKIISYKLLPDNWDSFGSKKISMEAIEESFNFIKYIQERHNYLFSYIIYTSPTVNGGVGIEIYNKPKQKKFIIEFDEFGKASYFLFLQSKLVFKNSLDDLDINQMLFKWLSA